MKNLLHICFLIGFLFEVQAYIPESSMILSRLVQHQGARNYKISQEVIFLDHSSLKEPLKFTEEWWRFSNRLFVEVKKDSQRVFSFSYRNSNKSWLNSKKRSVSQRKNYIENYFFIKPKISSWLSSVKNIYLERALGVVNYVFNLRKKDLAVWIEQDEFVIRKLKLKKDTWLTAQDYHLYSGRLFFPKKRTFFSPEMKVEMRVTSIRPLSSQEKTSRHLKLTSSLEDSDLVNRFYYQIR